MASAFIAEFVLTMFLLIIILRAADKLANGKFAGVAIKYCWKKQIYQYKGHHILEIFKEKIMNIFTVFSLFL